MSIKGSWILLGQALAVKLGKSNPSAESTLRL
jgi:hypothetical protein